ncbi:TraR/DksA family transcriptional regulator [endosymbiont of Acanthamoeba sp. UWC8]|uniref:TraR/DksA family transcriptional regulator n=1 Tax=endosymbiont of Acanthamoeba sp. UWC8 TaxID=86106 RepID=UPI0004D1D905|nr:TraR/DksA C4-type zinc finger protein [endosymbiont of Acanthamoeba sp. UWC8]AIF80642.1 TraR/DksA family transcriptional regulator [endosymbiont of Acanthamoeba sp. UWC8]
MINTQSDKQPRSYDFSDDEEYMSPQMLEYFKQKLLNWHDELLRKTREEDNAIHQGLGREPDHVDSAVNEVALENELIPGINHDRELLAQVEVALSRIEQGDYGFCSVTGEPIGFARLDAWPIATRSIEAQEEEEKNNKIHTKL